MTKSMKAPKNHYLMVWNGTEVELFNCSQETSPTDEVIDCMTKDEFYELDAESKRVNGCSVLFLPKSDVLNFVSSWKG